MPLRSRRSGLGSTAGSALGVYRFKVATTMAGRWALTLSAKLQGAAETITGTVVVTAR